MDTPSSKSMISRFLNKIGSSRKQAAPPEGARPFREHQEREGAYDRKDRGTQTVPLDQVIGSVGRYQDFDQQFRFRNKVASERFDFIVKAMREGRVLPPVKLYQIKDDYYVVDGNHRVAAAKKLNHDEILATVVELIPSNETFENILYKELMAFCEKTDLPRNIKLTELGQYSHLLGQISEHWEFLKSTDSSDISFETAAKDWHKTIYQPLCFVIKRGRLLNSFPDRTIADLYVYVSLCHWKKDRKRQYGIGIEKLIPKEMEEFRKKMADLKEFEYPEMKRGITAFVVLYVQGKKEWQIIDKLYALPEVIEVHSIHGDIDLLVKIQLTRDLLSSDAEVISNYVHKKIRLLNGVNSTKTLIPGVSRIKKDKD